MTIHRGEPHVGDFVEPLQFFHHERADVRRGDLLLRPLLERPLDAIRDRLERRDAHRALLARFEQPGDELLALEPLARAVLLHDHVGDFIDPLVAREALAAWKPPTAPGVGTATPIARSAIIGNVPVNGMSRRNAVAPAHNPAPIVSHSGNDHSSATTRRPGRRTAPRPRANRSTTPAIRAA